MAGFGVFGKMPSLGDFFRVGLPNSFVEPWDTWLQMGIHSARTELNNQWNECFMSAPIWRFTLGAGLAGPTAMMGVLMPSVDRVGRQFPLTLAMPIPHASEIPLAHFNGTEQFEHLERVALGALEDGFTCEMLMARLVQVPNNLPVISGQVNANGSAVCVVGQNPIGQVAASAIQLGAASSVWSAVLENDSLMLATAALPSPSQMRGLFDLNAPIWQEQTPAEASL
ncbi:MAG: type VI secretion system-associated protein TagF [Amylibacter sp.]